MPQLITELSDFTVMPGGQDEFWHDWENGFLFAAGGWGSGKTHIGARKLMAAHVWNAFTVEGEATFVPSVAVGQTYGSMADIQLPQLKATCEEFNLSYVWKAGDSELILPDLGTKKNPSKIMFRSADKPASITGWEVGAAWGDEAARWKEDRVNPVNDPYIQLCGRVRHPKSNYRVRMFTYTNEGDHTRIFEEAHSGKPGHRCFVLRTKDNLTPTIQEFYEVQRGILTKTTADQYLDGGAMSLRGGKVYSGWDKERNGLAAGERPWDYTRPLCVTFDFNIAPGMHIELGQRFIETDVFVVRHEIHRQRLDLPSSLEELKTLLSRLGGFKWPEFWLYGDSTGGSESVQTGESCYQMIYAWLADNKIPYKVKVPGQNPYVSDRINAVNGAFNDLFGKVHLKVDVEQCPRLVEDFKLVRYNDKGELDKSNQLITHPSDALGYWVHYERPIRVKTEESGGRFGVNVRAR